MCSLRMLFIILNLILYRNILSFKNFLCCIREMSWVWEWTISWILLEMFWKFHLKKVWLIKGYFCGVDQLLDFYKLDNIHYIGIMFLGSVFFQFRIMSMSYDEIKYHVFVQIRPTVDHFSWKHFFSWFTIHLNHMKVSLDSIFPILQTELVI